MFALRTVYTHAVHALLFASLIFGADAKSIPGKYIIQLRSDVSPSAFASHQAKVERIHAARMKARSINGPKFAGIEQTYQFGTFNAYAAAFDDATVKEISKLPEVPDLLPSTTVFQVVKSCNQGTCHRTGFVRLSLRYNHPTKCSVGPGQHFPSPAWLHRVCIRSRINHPNLRLRH